MCEGSPSAIPRRCRPASTPGSGWRSAASGSALRDRVVPTLDVRAALAAVESGNADAGIVYRTDAAISRRVRVALEVPVEEAPRIVYPAALLAGARGPAARAFFEHLRSPAAREVFERLGFEFLPAR